MTDDEKIDAIIHSLGHYALGNVKENLHLTIAGFILGSCFIDQMAHFRYKFPWKDTKKYTEFVKEYMEEYDGLKLCENLRSRLVHNYSLKYFKITNDESFQWDETNQYNTVLSVHKFYADIKEAFRKFCVDLKTSGKQARDHALEIYKTYPVLLHSDYKPILYQETHADKLQHHYSNIDPENLIGKTMYDNHDLRIFEIKKEPDEDLFAVKVYAKHNNGQTFWKHLNEVTEERDILSPRGVLIKYGLL